MTTFDFGIWFLGFSKKVLFRPNENLLGFHMRYRLFLVSSEWEMDGHSPVRRSNYGILFPKLF